MLPLLRRIFRLAFHAAAGFSTLAMVAVLFLWPWSYYRWDCFQYESLTRSYSVYTSAGILGFSGGNRFLSGRGPGYHHMAEIRGYGAAPDWSYTEFFNRVIRPKPDEVQRDYGWLGVRLQSARVGASWDIDLRIPFLYFYILSAPLPALWLRWFRRERQARRARPGFPIKPPPPPLPPTTAAR